MPEPRRKGASRIADIPPDVLRALEAGEIETATLVEWLAIDVRKLARAVPWNGKPSAAKTEFLRAVDSAAELGVGKRNKAIGAALHAAMSTNAELGPRCAEHRSDMVRSWAAYAYALGEGDLFAARLDRLKRFAADASMATRESAWDAWRPYFANDVLSGVRDLMTWVRDADPNVRRCAIEGTRPRGVWTPHIKALVAEPELARPLLEVVRSDSARYVQLAVGNWLNDAGKSQPEWLQQLAARWRKESKSAETEAILKRGLRNV